MSVEYKLLIHDLDFQKSKQIEKYKYKCVKKVKKIQTKHNKT